MMLWRRVQAASNGCFARQHGVALIVAVLAVLLLTVFTLALVLTTSTEVTIAANFLAGEQALHGADAALERAMQDAATLGDWNAILAFHAKSGFVDGPPSGSTDGAGRSHDRPGRGGQPRQLREALRLQHGGDGREHTRFGRGARTIPDGSFSDMDPSIACFRPPR